MRSARASSTWSRRASSMPPMANHGRARALRGQVPDRVQGGVRPAGFGRRRPDRAQAEVVDVGVHGGSGRLHGAVAAQPEQHVGADDPAGGGRRQVPLPDVQHVGTRRNGHVRPVVDGQQLAVPAAGVGEDGEQVELVRGLQVLLAQLDDVDPAGSSASRKSGRSPCSRRESVTGTDGHRQDGRRGRGGRRAGCIRHRPIQQHGSEGTAGDDLTCDGECRCQ